MKILTDKELGFSNYEQIVKPKKEKMCKYYTTYGINPPWNNIHKVMFQKLNQYRVNNNVDLDKTLVAGIAYMLDGSVILLKGEGSKMVCKYFHPSFGFEKNASNIANKINSDPRPKALLLIQQVESSFEGYEFRIIRENTKGEYMNKIIPFPG